MESYRRLHGMMERLAVSYEVRLENVVACFSALSPNNDYLGNLRSTVTLLEGRRRGLPVESCTVSTYGACKLRAWEFLAGEDFLTRTVGKKTRNFYINILDPEENTAVTIDGHMYCIWIGKRMTMRQAVRERMAYDAVADGCRELAAHEGMLPNQLQAMLWFTWKRIHNVVYSPQLNLLNPADHWNMDLVPEHIKPYRF